MTKSFSYTGSHPLEEVVKDLTTDRDDWKARAERAEAEAAALRAELDAATVVPINGVLYRVLPGAVGYTGDSSAGRRKPDAGQE